MLQSSRNGILSYIVEIGFALFESFALVNSFIAWRNQVLKDRSEKEGSWVKYGVQEARLKLITRWAKRASRHYEATQPEKKKTSAFSIIHITNNNSFCCNELEAHAVRPGSKHHDEPCPIPFNGPGYCVICGKTDTKNVLGVLPGYRPFLVCSNEQNNCFVEMRELRSTI